MHTQVKARQKCIKKRNAKPVFRKRPFPRMIILNLKMTHFLHKIPAVMDCIRLELFSSDQAWIFDLRMMMQVLWTRFDFIKIINPAARNNSGSCFPKSINDRIDLSARTLAVSHRNCSGIEHFLPGGVNTVFCGYLFWIESSGTKEEKNKKEKTSSARVSSGGCVRTNEIWINK